MWVERLENVKDGEVRFSAENGFTDLFLNACKSKGAVLNRVEFSEGAVTASVAGKDYKKVVEAAKLTGMDLRKISARGAGFLLRRYRARIGIPVGIVCGIVIYLILSGMIWSIDITGLETLRENEFRTFLSEMEVRKGMFAAAVDCGEIERRTAQFDPAVLRVTANLVGCKLFIHVKERAIPPQVKDEKEYCNIIAAKGGEILKASVLAGESRVKAGDTVHKGDLLVSGERSLRTGGTRLLIASASVIARTKTNLSSHAPAHIRGKSPSRMRDRFSLCFFGLDIPQREAQAIPQSHYLRTKDSVIPIGYRRSRKTEYADMDLILENGEAKLFAFSDLAQSVFSAMETTKILSCTITLSYADGAQIDCELTCEEDIAQEERFSLLSEQTQ